MSADVVIRAEGLGKQYVIGHQSSERVPTFRDAIVRNVNQFARTTADLLRGKPIIAGDQIEEFWALKDVSFEIRRGDVVGVIGRNGAGKSTLLKVLSRITEPSQGRVEIKGRVASLLEVGTGFHPELTGRENIFLNGAILGMSRNEIRRKFDEIVAFAEIEKFLDTPVKRYSSGMYVRLAFAVAAHLEPEILIVDEVLAVGDAEFQKKCLGKMQDVAGHGRTVLFVSHNMGAIASLCSRAILLANGHSALTGPVDEAISQYATTTSGQFEASYVADAEKPTITRICFDPELLARRSIRATIEFRSPFPLKTPVGGLILRAMTGEPVWGSNGRFHVRKDDTKSLTEGHLLCEVNDLPLRSGTYSASIWLGDWHTDHDSKVDCLVLQLGEETGNVHRPPPSITGHLDWAATWRSFHRSPTAN